jgi:phage terminase large subunit-like protein
MASAPRLLTPVSDTEIQSGEGADVSLFLESYCTVTKDSIGGKAGEPLVLRPWQKSLVNGIFAHRPDGRRKHRECLIGMPRKNGKSALLSGIGLYGLLMSGVGAEVYSCAADKDQAKIVFSVAKKMVDNNEELSAVIKPYRDALEVLSTGSVYKAVSSEAYTKEGLSPSMCIYDELHAAPDDDLHSVMTLAMGARVDPILIAITTAGVRTDRTGSESICYRNFQYGERICSGEISDPTYFMAWWGATDNDRHDNPEVWRRCNPGYGDLVDPEDLSSSVLRVRENEFRTKRLNQWVDSAEAWLPAGLWESRRRQGKRLSDFQDVVLGFDGSKSNDSTALVAVSVESAPHVEVIGLWEKPRGNDDWRVPREDVKNTIREACKRFRVFEIAWDEWLWVDAAEELEAEGLPVVVFPQTMQRMAPATQRFYELVTTGQISHDGDPRLTRHLRNALLKIDARGQRLVKDARNTSKKIDLAVASVMATDRANWWSTQPGPDTFGGKKINEIGFVW